MNAALPFTDAEVGRSKCQPKQCGRSYTDNIDKRIAACLLYGALQ
jgi:hypothetical protein